MTQLQMEFNKLREQQRANLVNEQIKQQEADVKSKQADIQEAEVTLKSVETQLKQMKAPAEITNLLSQADLNSANTQKSLTQIGEVLSSIKLLQAQAGLTSTQRQRQEIGLVQDFMSFLHRIVGINFAGDTEDTIYDWIGSFLGGGFKGLIG